MICLKPDLEILPRDCPKCRATLAADGWLISGMRNLADLSCPNCKTEFYGDLPSGQALYTPMLLEKESGKVYDDYNAGWFSDWLEKAYANRTDEKIPFETRKFSEIKDKVIFLNCLDGPYGDLLHKLLNAQHYIDYHQDASLIVLAPRFLEWLLPDGIAEAWIVDLPLRRGTEWNDWLANEIGERLKPFSKIYLSIAFPHPHSTDFDIERFTRVAPFPLENLGKHQNKPIITFIWREDRLWKTEGGAPSKFSYERVKNRFGFSEKQIDEQTRKVVEFAELLREKFPAVDFAVAGLGKTNNFPEWISDLRLTELDADEERAWCKRYSESHVVIGVYGSNMLLPSAHAGSVIDLVGEEWWHNYLQDVLFRQSDGRDMIYRYRFVPHSTAPEHLAILVSTLLRYEDFKRNMGSEFCRHQSKYNFTNLLSKRSIQTK
ncbi:MAG: hypothetical protein ACR2IA_01965 [Pyrinomonadaceae bacterium]